MTITDFKSFADLTHNNKENAGKAWSRGWGYGTLASERWAYKEWTFSQHGMTFVYRSGKVLCRHGSYSQTTYTINGDKVGRSAFLKRFGIALSGGYDVQAA